MKMRFKLVSAPGKIIISGEHVVVHGYPALVSAVDKRLLIDVNGNINSTIPIGAGMGSSAAWAVATSGYNLLKSGKNWDLDIINENAYELEKKQHGSPSGADNTVSTFGGFLWYRKETETLKTFKSLKVKQKYPDFFVINSGKPLETTGEMVKIVGESLKKNGKQYKRYFDNIEQITKSFAKYLLGEETPDLNELISENEILLEKIGVVSKSTILLVKKLKQIGASAKVCGAGGAKENSGILLVYHKDSEKLLKYAKGNNLDIFGVKLGARGVKYT